jgi:cytochrome b561
MLALGGLLTSAAILALAALALVFRNPNPPRWTTSSWAGELISVGLVSLFALGLAMFVAGAVGAYREGLQLIDLGLLAAVLLGALVIWRRLDLRAAFRAMPPEPVGTDARSAEPVATTSLPPAATEPLPSQPTPRVA